MIIFVNCIFADYKEPWLALDESREQYSLRWESKYLLELGKAFEYIFSLAVGVATQEALKYTILSGKNLCLLISIFYTMCRL